MMKGEGSSPSDSDSDPDSESRGSTCSSSGCGDEECDYEVSFGGILGGEAGGAASRRRSSLTARRRKSYHDNVATYGEKKNSSLPSYSGTLLNRNKSDSSMDSSLNDDELYELACKPGNAETTTRLIIPKTGESGDKMQNPEVGTKYRSVEDLEARFFLEYGRHSHDFTSMTEIKGPQRESVFERSRLRGKSRTTSPP